MFDKIEVLSNSLDAELYLYDLFGETQKIGRIKYIFYFL